MDTARFRIDDLLGDAAFPHPVTQFQLKETHISWVVLTGPFAYKIKKPVHYDFVDASTLDRRKFLCEEEVRLNRRFAPDLYLGAIPIVNEGGQLRVGGRGNPVEFAVKMHQFDASQEMAELLARHPAAVPEISGLGASIADGHLRAAVAPADSPFGTFRKVKAPMLDNFCLLHKHLSGARELERLRTLSSWTDATLARLEPLIDARRDLGMVRECHGDLHARNIVYWRQQWLPFDCLEFDPDLRWIDVISDVAFLFMDLTSRRREDLACEFLSRYLEETGDYDGLPLLPLHASYFALVRAKVDALGAETAGCAQRLALETRLMERLATATRFMDAKSPAIILMHGVTASGKSWLSGQLVSALPALRIRSDLERKRLAGVAPLARRIFGVGQGTYAPATTQATYERLLESAERVLDGNCNVVVDATFLESAHRDMFHRLALRRRCPFLIVSCMSDTATLRSRLQTRANGGLDPSEATQEVLDHQLRSHQPLGAEELNYAVRIDTSSLNSARGCIAALKARLMPPVCPEPGQSPS